MFPEVLNSCEETVNFNLDLVRSYICVYMQTEREEGI